MNGICGVLIKGGTHKLERLEFQNMATKLDGNENNIISCRIMGSVGLGVNSLAGSIGGIFEKEVNNKRVAMAFSGDLFNQAELCLEGGDPERILPALFSLYLKEGMGFIKRLRGEFAFLVWDSRNETFFAATDRFRVYPLYYALTAQTLIVSSRLETIFANSFGVNREINVEAIIDFMAFSSIPTPKTIYKDIQKIPPGYILSCHKSGVPNLTCYWDVNFSSSLANRKNQEELTTELRSALLDAVSVRMNQDSCHDLLGTFLSGGVDSSTLTALVMQLADSRIKSFSIGFKEEKYNEMSYARIAARSSGSEHHEYFVTPKDVRDCIPTLIEAFDEPFGNASSIPTFFCAKLAKEHGIGTLYGGDGGDEIFAGNERYASQKRFDYYHNIPGWARRFCIEPTVSFLGNQMGMEFFKKGEKYIRRANIPYPDRLWSYGIFNLHPLNELYAHGVLQAIDSNYNPYDPIARHYSSALADTALDRQMYIDLKLSISDNDLFKVTRMTDAAGVKVRFPFLDHRLVEFAATVPAKIKMVGRNLRFFFKHAYSDILPPEVIAKTKHGFGLPISVWLRTDKALNEMMRDLVLSPRSISREFYQEKFLETLIEYHQTDQSSFYGTIIWNIMVLELWNRRYFDRTSI
jgi:asparagine synthase (glutamine-hydrolysing)